MTMGPVSSARTWRSIDTPVVAATSPQNASSRRREVSLRAAKYAAALKDICETAVVRPNCRHSFNYYTIRFVSKAVRDNAQKVLTERGIASQIYYPVSLHLQKAYARLGYKPGDLPVSERTQDLVLSLPMFPELTADQVRTVTKAIKAAVSARVAG